MYFFKVVLILLITISSSAFAIRNGTVVSKRAHPTLVHFKIGSNTCTGIRISYDYALTAAHCFSNLAWKTKIKATFMNGKILLSKRISIKKVTIYGEDSSVFDLAAVEITPKKGSLENTVIAALDTTTISELSLNESFKIYGFGLNQAGSLGKLRTGDVSFKELYYRDVLPMIKVIPTKSNTLPCPGDSGGPLFKVDEAGIQKLVGVISFISSSTESLIKKDQKVQCEKADRAYYVPIVDHMNFIEKFLDK
jgi:secreted trypsin-like serine protease